MYDHRLFFLRHATVDGRTDLPSSNIENYSCPYKIYHQTAGVLARAEQCGELISITFDRERTARKEEQ